MGAAAGKLSVPGVWQCGGRVLAGGLLGKLTLLADTMPQAVEW